MSEALRLVPISDLAEINPRTILPYRTECSFISMEDVSEEGRWTGANTRSSTRAAGYTTFRNHDVLFAKITPCMENGKGAFVSDLKSGYGIGSTEFHVLRAKDDSDPRFIAQWMQSRALRARAAASMTGSAGQRRVPASFFGTFYVPHFNLPEQRKIAEILYAADEAIRSTERVIAKLEQAKQGLLHDLLIRQSWPTSSVHEIALRVTDGDHHTPIKSTAGISLIGAGNVQDGYLNLSNEEFVNEAEYDRMITRCHPEAGDILISCSGSIGRVAQVPAGLRLALVRSVALVKPDTGKCLSGFLELALQSSFVQRQIKNTQKQLAQANLFQGAISKLQIPLPEVSKQRAIVERVTSYRAAITTAGRELSKLCLLKHGLMDDLLTGRVQVETAA